MNRGSIWSGLAAIVACVFAIAASAQEPRPQVAQAPAAGAVLGSAQFGADPDLRCDLLEVKRVSGGALTIRWRVVNGTGAPGGLTGAAGKKIHYTFHWDDLYYIDPAENKKYQFLTDAAGNRILDVSEGDYAPGQQRVQWAKFPAPPASSTKISIAIPKFAPFEDIPISP
jgi:hypothetical protein